MSQSEVSHIMAGSRRVAAYDLLARIARAFEIPPGFMGLAWADDPPTCPGEVDPDVERLLADSSYRRDLLGVAASLAIGATVPNLVRWLPSPSARSGGSRLPRRVGMADVAQLRAATRALWELC